MIIPDKAPKHMIPLAALGRPIAFHQSFRQISGSTVAALFLSQAWYWTKTLPDNRDGWFYKERDEWQRETGLSHKEQSTARKHLKEKGLLLEERRGLNPTLWYCVNQEVLTQLLAENNQGHLPECRTGSQASAESALTLPTETTTETTSFVQSPKSKQNRKKELNDTQRAQFERWYSLYPKKVARAKAEESWLSIDPDDELVERMIAKINEWAESADWQKDAGQYIPMPSTWLNQERWNDDSPKIAPKNIQRLVV